MHTICKLPLLTRVWHAWLVLCGKADLLHTPEQTELLLAMSALDDALARLKAASAAAIAKGTTDSAAAANAAATAAALEASTVSTLTGVSADLDHYSGTDTSTVVAAPAEDTPPAA